MNDKLGRRHWGHPRATDARSRGIKFPISQYQSYQ